VLAQQLGNNDVHVSSFAQTFTSTSPIGSAIQGRLMVRD
jgi:hypothetical protein